MLKETKTEETIVFFVKFLSLVAFQLGGGGRAPWAHPLATLMQESTSTQNMQGDSSLHNLVMQHCDAEKDEVLQTFVMV